MDNPTDSPSIIPPRVSITDDDLTSLTKEDLWKRWKDNEAYIDYLEKLSEEPKEEENKLKLQQQESARRENVLVMRLTAKEQEMQELLAQIQALKQPLTPSAAQLQNMLLDPAVNLLFEKMKTEVTETKEKLEQAQNDLSAWKFTPDSVTGKKLMAKCRMLIQENQDLGKQLSQGRIAQLEAELALQKKYSEELKESQEEMNEFVVQLDEEVEGMQATICTLQKQLKDAKSHSDSVDEKNKELQTKIESMKMKAESLSLPKNPLVSLEYNRTSNDLVKEELLSVHSPVNPSSIDYEGISNDSFSNQDTATHIVSHKERLEERTFSPTLTNHLKIEPNDPMEIDQIGNNISKVLSPKNHILNNTEDLQPLLKPLSKTFSGNENLTEKVSSQRLSPNKTITKTSFSITDLLSDKKESVKKETIDMPMEVSLTLKNDENNVENGTLNGEIDDTAI